MSNVSKTEYLSKCDWGDIALKLTAFVIQYMNHCVAKKYKEWNFPNGYTAEDVAYKAISDVLDGTRNWNQEKHPDLINYLQFSVCRSIISNLYSKAETKTTFTITQSDYFGTDENSNSIEYYDGASMNFGLYFEQDIDNEHFLNKLEDELKTDQIGQLVLLSILEGNQTREIAKDLEISESEVSNAKKRIRRVSEKIQSILQN